MTVPVKATFSLIICAALWSTSGIFIKSIAWNPLAIAGLRSLLGGIVILIYLRRPVFTFSFPQIAAGVANAVTMIMFVSATKLTTSANAILLQYSAPIFVAVLGWMILKEKPRWEHWTGLVLIIAGIAIFFLDKVSAGNHLGNLIAAASGLTFAFYPIFMRMQKDGSPAESVLIAHALTFLVTLPFLFTTRPEFTLGSLGAILFLGTFQIGFSAIFFSYGIKHVSAIQTMLITGLEPILNPVWVYFIIGERPSPNAIVGGIIILFAVTFSSLISARRAIMRGRNDSRRMSQSDAAKDPASPGTA